MFLILKKNNFKLVLFTLFIKKNFFRINLAYLYLLQGNYILYTNISKHNNRQYCGRLSIKYGYILIIMAF